MAKKSTKKKTEQPEPPAVEEDSNAESFEDMCKKFREAKIVEKKNEKVLTEYKDKIKDFVIQNKLEKGDYNGIKVSYRLSFSSENVKLAQENEIEVPQFTSLSLTPERVQELIKSGVIKEDEIVKSPNLKELEEIMKEKKLEAKYEASLALGLSAYQ